MKSPQAPFSVCKLLHPIKVNCHSQAIFILHTLLFSESILIGHITPNKYRPQEHNRQFKIQYTVIVIINITTQNIYCNLLTFLGNLCNFIVRILFR